MILNWATDGTIAFGLRTDSESNDDYLIFEVDGVQRDRWSGTTPWMDVSFPVTAGMEEADAWRLVEKRRRTRSYVVDGFTGRVHPDETSRRLTTFVRGERELYFRTSGMFTLLTYDRQLGRAARPPSPDTEA